MCDVTCIRAYEMKINNSQSLEISSCYIDKITLNKDEYQTLYTRYKNMLLELFDQKASHEMTGNIEIQDAILIFDANKEEITKENLKEFDKNFQTYNENNRISDKLFDIIKVLCGLYLSEQTRKLNSTVWQELIWGDLGMIDLFGVPYNIISTEKITNESQIQKYQTLITESKIFNFVISTNQQNDNTNIDFWISMNTIKEVYEKYKDKQIWYQYDYDKI